MAQRCEWLSFHGCPDHRSRRQRSARLEYLVSADIVNGSFGVAVARRLLLPAGLDWIETAVAAAM
jgi:hypothetical protein